MRTVYVNGEYLPEADAKVSIFDRGFLFADGVYEVTAVLEGRLVDFGPHFARLRRSLGELKIDMPVSESELLAMHRELVSRNGVDEGGVYLQITRGVADRDFAFPAEETTPGIVAFTQTKPLRNPGFADAGVSVVTVPEIRWQRRDIKSVALLGQVLGKQLAKEQGAFEGWMVEDGVITEGTSSTAFIVRENRLITRPLSNAVLPGVTRLSILDLVDQTGLDLEERTFTPEEAYAATEAFLTSASTFVAPITDIDGHRIGAGKPGPVATKLREIYIQHALETAV